MKVAAFNARSVDREFLSAANKSHRNLQFFEPYLDEETVGLATGLDVVCVFVHDHVTAAVIDKFHSLGVRLIRLWNYLGELRE